VRAFADARDWGGYHTPKNLAMALGGETGELLAEFQWLTPEESVAVMDNPETAVRVREEMADVFAYLLRLADVLDVDLAQALLDKMERNEIRFPVPPADRNATRGQLPGTAPPFGS
jgi:NTP pyrophosphatase (non-canonical NTP hydrolase)